MKIVKYISLVISVFLCPIAIYAGNAGDLDPTFGSGGKVFANPSGLIRANAVALQSDGKIVMVGVATGPDNTDDFAAARLNADGSPDNTFGTGGLVRVPFATGANEMATAVSIQPDGKIIVAGSVELGSHGWDFGVIRLTTAGVVDNTF